MGLVAGINRVIALFLETLRQFGRGKAWLLLLLLSAIYWVILYAHYQFVSPIFFGPVTFWTRLIGESSTAAFTHYPTHLLVLPYFYGWAKLLLGLVIEGTVLGMVAVVFYNAFRGSGAPALSTGRVWRVWLHLVLAWAILNGLVVAMNLLLPELFGSLINRSPRRIAAFQLTVIPFVYAVLLSLFFTAIPAIAVYGDNVIRGIGRSLRSFAEHPIGMFVVAGIILIGPVAINFLTGQSETIVRDLRPDLVYWVLVAGLVIDIFANFFWMGTAVRILVSEESESTA
jgi:hypothetical protein